MEFNIDGVYHGARPEEDETQFWFQWEYFKESVPDAIKGQVGWYTIRIANPDDAPRIAKTIDNMYLNSPYETKTETESAFAAGLGEAIRKHQIPDYVDRDRRLLHALAGHRQHDGDLRARANQ